MGKRREKTQLELIAESLRLNDLRLRIAADLPNTREQRQLAVIELTKAQDALAAYIEQIRGAMRPRRGRGR